MQRLAGFTIAAILALSVACRVPQPELVIKPAEVPQTEAGTKNTENEVGPAYYVITEGTNLGDHTIRVPITADETVFDALCQIGGLSQTSDKKIWIARRDPGAGCDQILPIDWESIASGRSAATNYEILPGDRVYVSEDSAKPTFWDRMLAPVERMLGITSIGASTIRDSDTIGRSAAQPEPQTKPDAGELLPGPLYRVKPFAVLQIQVQGTLLDQPIDGYYMVEEDGTINLGATYGTVRVAHLTIDEITQTVTAHLTEILARPEVSVRLARTSSAKSMLERLYSKTSFGGGATISNEQMMGRNYNNYRSN